MAKPSRWLAFGFGSGLLPKAPGTWGTLAAVPGVFLLAQLPTYAYVIALGLAFALGVWCCGQAAKDLQQEDHGAIVWDEFVGFWIAMAGIPVTGVYLVLAFVLFRVFDMLKPWPISWADRRVKGGFGIMFDDALAGVATWICLMLIYHVGGLS